MGMGCLSKEKKKLKLNTGTEDLLQPKDRVLHISES